MFHAPVGLTYILFDYVDLEVVEGDLLYETVRAEARLGGFLEFFDVGIQPDGDGQVELLAGGRKRRVDLSRAVQVGRVLDGRIVYQMVVVYDLAPHAKHRHTSVKTGE